ncbi:MAG: thermonuclease family protein [Gammaproteobacteria bacterium]|nr:thermonuclease family protein [Gammaproteobacteria bacterium]
MGTRLLHASALAAMLLSALFAQADSPRLAGVVAGVSGGDTIDVTLDSGPATVRLDSIYAPESDQPGGARAREALSERLLGQKVELQVVTKDRYGRLVAVVFLNGENINRAMLQDGHA